MHDKTNDEETKKQVNSDINEYFNLESIGLEDLNKKVSEIRIENIDSKKENNQEE